MWQNRWKNTIQSVCGCVFKVVSVPVSVRQNTYGPVTGVYFEYLVRLIQSKTWNVEFWWPTTEAVPPIWTRVWCTHDSRMCLWSILFSRNLAFQEMWFLRDLFWSEVRKFSITEQYFDGWNQIGGEIDTRAAILGWFLACKCCCNCFENTYRTVTGKYFANKAQFTDRIGKTKQLCDGTKRPAGSYRSMVRWTSGLEPFFPDSMISEQSPL